MIVRRQRHRDPGRRPQDRRVADVMATEGDLIAPLKAELELLAKRQVIREENQADAKRPYDHGRQGHPVPPAAQDHVHQRARQLHRRVVRGAAEARSHERRASTVLAEPTAVARCSFRSAGPAVDACARRRRGALPAHHAAACCSLCALICMPMPWLPRPKPDRTQAAGAAAADGAPPDRAGARSRPRRRRRQGEPERPSRSTRGRERRSPSRKARLAKPERAAKVALNKEAPVPEARVPVPNKPPGEVDAARRKAAGIGLLAMKDDMHELHGAPIAVQLHTRHQAGPGRRHRRRRRRRRRQRGRHADAHLITSNATGGSGGINTAAYSQNTGGGGLAGRSTTLVEGVIGGGGGGGYGGGGARGRGDGTGSGWRLRRQRHRRRPAARAHQGGSGKASRSIEECKPRVRAQQGLDLRHLQPGAARRARRCRARWCSKLTIAPTGNVVDVRDRVERAEDARARGASCWRGSASSTSAPRTSTRWSCSYPVDFLPS